MKYLIIVRPIIGAIIGYVTNWVAVKMLFRPINPIKIGKFTVPFTPGIIPKNKERIANAIGNTISENLITDNILKEKLLSDEYKNVIREKTKKIIEEKEPKLLDIIVNSVKDADLGNIISEQIEKVAKEKMKGSIIGIFGGEKIVSTISNEANEKINEYIENDGKILVTNMLETEMKKYSKNGNIEDVVLNIYEKIVDEKLAVILKELNISQMVSDKIKEMDMLELEKLILSIMKNELNALVNLGAIIGLVLGLVNLLF